MRLYQKSTSLFAKKNAISSVAVIGSGFAALSAASYLAQAGCTVDVYEKNGSIGGRARYLTTTNGYTFDMGPSWYWMPEVFEKFFADFGYEVPQLYQLEQLDPGFSVVYGKNDVINIPANFKGLCDLFESIEAGSSEKLKLFLDGASYKYKIGMEKLVYKPGLSLFEFADKDLIKGLFKLEVFNSFSKHIRRYFKDPRLIALMEFPVLFLGAMPEETPALYSLMNYAGLKLGTWYPEGGFGTVIDAMRTVAEKQGVNFYTNESVTKLNAAGKLVNEVVTTKQSKQYDGVIAGADYNHVESKLLESRYRNYNEKYWESRVMAPSSLIFYLGLNRKVAKLQHHNLFFDAGLQQHAVEIYKEPKWPSKPLFYVCCPSKTDATVAPEGHENLFVLMPLAPGADDTEALRKQYFDLIMSRLEKHTDTNIRTSIDYKKSYCVNDFVADYNSFKGNAYGLANTLMQTANLKPSIKNKHLDNLFYTGQLTVPGPGVPPSIISGKVAAQQMIKYLNKLS
ncbi:phytoene desaturase family protein [Mucilaginibacter gilvus]|uniref:Phytoene desaturase n=1 Tax=Mucilaginibacter gilvus TaxID=2305909 RepID=A0A444MQW0_9SPHI|nr:phytoene desaturase family protein [Mucilaginibacter gilvus]RWY54018.1 phytoene desaturase [Mucilaginibacter gilvus]